MRGDAAGRSALRHAADEYTAKLWAIGGALERTFEMGSRWVLCVAALLDGVHFVVGLGTGHDDHEVRLYHVDGTLVHTFEGHNAEALSLQ